MQPGKAAVFGVNFDAVDSNIFQYIKKAADFTISRALFSLNTFSYFLTVYCSDFAAEQAINHMKPTLLKMKYTFPKNAAIPYSMKLRKANLSEE